ncbi:MULTISPECIES: site-specific integrase [unclassified Crossiella]|uniref:tyrosine-type recombinase/integrase n=1 Tax=unclassified Crossiella TaxID=2620835 RepID=UPI001FFFDF6A|nr:MULTISPECIES: site-specific integrase [unclassified Crossiella]MCK2237818.1 site-specific integrase [Crossiella sp. S99.2]MCK2255104.1 site-specific integrase [Crossiella sp. S99.1]
MAHIEDRWFKTTEDSETGKQIRERTKLYGKGLRYRARYFDLDGNERSKSFRDKCKKQAEDFLLEVESDKRSGKYVDPAAGRVTVRAFANKWFGEQCFDGTTRNSVEWRLRNHVFPYLGEHEIGSVLPTHIRGWLRWMQGKKLAGGTRAVTFVYLSAIFSAAVDDKKISENPCKAKSITRPQPDSRKVVPWSMSKLAAVRLALGQRYKIVVPLGAGCGLRQGEIFGVSDVDIDRSEQMLNVVRQVRWVDNVAVFAPPKGGKERQVPISPAVLRDLDTHMEAFPPVEVTLPWLEPNGEPETVRLILVNQDGKAVRRQVFNQWVWNPAVARAKVPRVKRQDGVHALRHLFASVLLDAGESIKALAEWLGHTDPAFTMRVYTHLLPSSAERARQAIDRALGGSDPQAETAVTRDGLETA